MKIVLAILAVFCGGVVLLEIPTGNLSAAQVLAVGVISAAMAVVAP